MKSNLTTCINIPVAGICHFLPQHLYSVFLSIVKGAGCLGGRLLRSPASWFLFRFCPWACDSHKDMHLDLPQKKPPPKRAQLTESLQLPHLWTHPRLAPGPHSLAFLPITGLAPKGSLCSRTPNWPGQDAFKSMLTFEALHLSQPSFSSLTSVRPSPRSEGSPPTTSAPCPFIPGKPLPQYISWSLNSILGPPSWRKAPITKED